MKKLMFISPVFFDYYKEITRTIEETGRYSVKWYGDRPSEKFLDKAIVRYSKKLLTRKNNKYFKLIKQDCIENQYDVVLVIFGQFLNKKYIWELKEVLPSAKFIYYTWDSCRNYSVINEIADEFDVKYSFDSKDCETFGFQFLPLYYSNEQLDLPVEYDASAIFTVKPGKLKNYENVKKALPKNINFYEHLYLQSKLVYRIYKLKYKAEFKNYKIHDFKYYKLSREEVNTLSAKSKVVIDCQMQNQVGLTIRTFETLNLGKKLITTNCTIKDYDFYDDNNIFVIEEKGRSVPLDFITSSFKEKDMSNYSIQSFVHKLLETVK